MVQFFQNLWRYKIEHLFVEANCSYSFIIVNRALFHQNGTNIWSTTFSTSTNDDSLIVQFINISTPTKTQNVLFFFLLSYLVPVMIAM